MRHVALSALLLSMAPCAEAGLFRAYLASYGNDANPCTVVAPCRLLPAALAAVNDGGSIWMLDSANYNVAPVNVAKAVTILAIPGAVGSVVGSGGSAIEVTAGASVTLRNLDILDFSGGIHGIHMTGGAKLRVEGCSIHGLPGTGIMIETAAQVAIVDSIVRDNGAHGLYLARGTASVSRTLVAGNGANGIWVNPWTTSTVRAFVSDTVLNNNGNGLVVEGIVDRLARAYVTRSTASGNVNSAFRAVSFSAPGDAVLELSASVASGNGAYGLLNEGATIQSAGDNRISANAPADTLGAITLTVSQ